MNYMYYSWDLDFGNGRICECAFPKMLGDGMKVQDRVVDRQGQGSDTPFLWY
jgi:hypothetical protein